MEKNPEKYNKSLEAFQGKGLRINRSKIVIIVYDFRGNYQGIHRAKHVMKMREDAVCKEVD